MKTRARPAHLETFPRREVLETLARHYHHLHHEHKRAAPESSVRRRIEPRLLQVHERFEQLLVEWVPDEELRQAWRAYLSYDAPEPPGPAPIRPLVFRGTSDNGSVIDVRGKQGEELAVEIDGSLAERIVADKDFAALDPSFRFRLDDTEFHETFSASGDALDALADFVAEGGSPPWEHAAELLADGLIDTHAALTPRGRRALARRASGAPLA
jgi:hypothetical protein